MKKLFLLLAVSGLILASCGKKAEPAPEVTPEPQEVVAPAPEPTPEPAPAPAKKPTTTEVKKTEMKEIETKAVQTKAEVKKEVKPVERTLEEKLKHLNEYSPEEQKAILKQAQEQNKTSVGTTPKTQKGTK
ncbi:MAG: hypothetical protein RBS29_00620 [Bacteroidales bacterium]|jgi:hypothetical protein|nr:hypothetical protein [Bacteroidales bacterium]